MKPNKRFYGRRRTRSLRQKEKDLMKTFLPEIEIVPSSDGTFLDLSTYFGKSTQQFCLEVGFGKGEHLLWQAQNIEDVGFIGAEPFLNGVASLLSKIKEKNINNIRIFPDTVSQILHSLPSQSINKVFVLFPDPWPKSRHQKRRLINIETLDIFARIMTDDAELRLATDDAEYASWMLRLGLSHKSFEWTALRPDDWRIRPSDWPLTRYEEKNRSGGLGPVYLRFVRLPRN